MNDPDNQPFRPRPLWWRLRSLRQIVALYLAVAIFISILELLGGASIGRAAMMGLGIWPGLIVFILLLTSRNRALAEPMDLFPDDKAPRPPTG